MTSRPIFEKKPISKYHCGRRTYRITNNKIDLQLNSDLEFRLFRCNCIISLSAYYCADTLSTSPLSKCASLSSTFPLFPSYNWLIPAVNNSAGSVFITAGRLGGKIFQKNCANVSSGMWPPSGVGKARGQAGFILGQVCASRSQPRPKPPTAAAAPPAPPKAATPPELQLLTSSQF